MRADNVNPMQKGKSTFFGKLLNKRNRQNVDVQIDLLEYEEDGIFFVYSPALELIGYGNTHNEARSSWETVLEEYISYTLNKNTLEEDLKKLGWKPTGKKNQHRFTPPTLTWMLQHKNELQEVVDNHNFHKRSAPISMPFELSPA